VTIRLIYSGTLARRQVALLSISIVLAFAAIVLLVLRLLPGPHTRLQYLIAGTTPTVLGVAMAMVFIRRSRPGV
jgi:hypothetical protein